MKRSEKWLSETPAESRPLRKKMRSSTLAEFIVTGKFGERNDDVNPELRSAFNAVIDIFESEIKIRFSDNSEILLAISQAQELCYEKLAPLKQLGIVLPNKEEVSVAKVYLERRKRDHEERESLTKSEKNTFKNRFNVLSELYKMKAAFPQVYKMMAVVDTFGSSTTICECSFSALERLGVPKRISMNEDRLRHLTFFTVEKKRVAKISVDEVINRFNKNPKRKMQMY